MKYLLFVTAIVCICGCQQRTTTPQQVNNTNQQPVRAAAVPAQRTTTAAVQRQYPQSSTYQPNAARQYVVHPNPQEYQALQGRPGQQNTVTMGSQYYQQPAPMPAVAAPSYPAPIYETHSSQGNNVAITVPIVPHAYPVNYR